jgi:hypothetical protein
MEEQPGRGEKEILKRARRPRPVASARNLIYNRRVDLCRITCLLAFLWDGKEGKNATARST